MIKKTHQFLLTVLEIQRVGGDRVPEARSTTGQQAQNNHMKGVVRLQQISGNVTAGEPCRGHSSHDSQELEAGLPLALLGRFSLFFAQPGIGKQALDDFNQPFCGHTQGQDERDE